MNIGFDATAILGPGSKNRGIGNYALNQFSTMVDLDQNNKYFMFNVFEPFELRKFVKNKDNIVCNYIYTGKNRELVTDEKYKSIFQQLVEKFLIENDIDVFYITSPFDGNCLSYEKEWFGNIKVVATVYDIIPYLFREDYLNDDSAYEFYLSKLNAIQFVDKLIVISESVKNDLVNYLKVPESKIEVIWGAPDKRFCHFDVSKGDKEELMTKYGIHNKFIMCTGGSDSRKNLLSLIHAYSILPKEILDEYQLVIVCKLSESQVEFFNKVSEQYGVGTNVVLTNFVTDDQLRIFYNMASVVAFPSKYEGFGLPVVEAFACEKPVVTSNNSSLVEIAGDAAVLVNPFDVKSISDGLRAVLDVNVQKRIINNGKTRLEFFSWENVAKRTIKALCQIDRESEIIRLSNSKIPEALFYQIAKDTINYTYDKKNLILLAATLAELV